MLKFCGDRIAIAPVFKMTLTKDIKTFTETTIAIIKETAGLGLGIVGGTDTYLGGVVVNIIEPGGAAAKDGRIAVGDQILEVNGESLQKMSHKNAVYALRLASSPVRITILREDPEAIFTSSEEPSMVFEVKLVKSITDYIGLSILARKDKKGVFVTYVSENGIAYREGTIYQGDKLLEVNGVNLKKSTQEEACKALRRTFGTVKLKVGRIPSLHASFTSSKTKGSYVNHGIEDDEGPTKEFRRWNSFGFDRKKKRKIPQDIDNQVPTRRRSLSCRDYSQVSDFDLGGLEQASSEHDIRGNSPVKTQKRNVEPKETFRYIEPERIELSLQRDQKKQGPYHKEAIKAS